MIMSFLLVLCYAVFGEGLRIPLTAGSACCYSFRVPLVKELAFKFLVTMQKSRKKNEKHIF